MKMGFLQRTFINRGHSEAKRVLVEMMLTKSELEQVNKTLEVGCGTGTTSASLNSRLNMDVTGIDIDPRQIEIARRKHGVKEGLKFIEADATEMPFDDAEFDMVVSLMVLHHINAWERMLDEVARVLKPGGIYVCHDQAYTALSRRIVRQFLSSHGIYTLEEALDYLQQKGLSVIREPIFRQYHIKQIRTITMVARKG